MNYKRLITAASAFALASCGYNESSRDFGQRIQTGIAANPDIIYTTADGAKASLSSFGTLSVEKTEPSGKTCTQTFFSPHTYVVDARASWNPLGGPLMLKTNDVPMADSYCRYPVQFSQADNDAISPDMRMHQKPREPVEFSSMTESTQDELRLRKAQACIVANGRPGYKAVCG